MVDVVGVWDKMSWDAVTLDLWADETGRLDQGMSEAPVRPDTSRNLCKCFALPFACPALSQSPTRAC